MIKVKHFLDPVEKDDGQRIWVESIGLGGDFREWCKVDQVLSHLGPPRALAEWLEDHPDGFDYFRAQYHDFLARSPFKPVLEDLARISLREPITFLHHGDDPEYNTASALQHFVNELEAWVKPE